MKRFATLLALLAAVCLAAPAAHAQTTCSPTAPCVGVAWNDANMAATVTFDANQNQTLGPGTTVLWRCMGSTTTCSQTALNAAMAGQTLTKLCPSQAGAWECVTFPQTTPAAQYNDPEPYGSLMNYAVQASWPTITGNQGGVSAATPIFIFSMPASPARVPVVPTPGVPALVISGTVGPQ